RPAGGTRPGPDGRARDHGSWGRRLLRRGLPGEPGASPQRVAVRAAPGGHLRLHHRLHHRPADLADLRQAPRPPRLTRAGTADTAGPGPGRARTSRLAGLCAKPGACAKPTAGACTKKARPGAGALLSATNMRSAGGPGPQPRLTWPEPRGLPSTPSPTGTGPPARSRLCSVAETATAPESDPGHRPRQITPGTRPSHVPGPAGASSGPARAVRSTGTAAAIPGARSPRPAPGRTRPSASSPI